jgi:hypothetical protein
MFDFELNRARSAESLKLCDPVSNRRFEHAGRSDTDGFRHADRFVDTMRSERACRDGAAMFGGAISVILGMVFPVTSPRFIARPAASRMVSTGALLSHSVNDWR